jgi:3'(2'), 5'-bisphosphate nucleotidase
LKGGDTDSARLVEAFVEAACEAGREILRLRRQGLDAARKSDGSPVTAADLAAERLIRARLAASLPGLPLIGEEGGQPAEGDKLPDAFVLVDPLDGTRDFLKGSAEFTVNIALISGARPLAGVVLAPALGRLFAGSQEGGAFEMRVDPEGQGDLHGARRRIAVREVPKGGPVALESRSHPDAATASLLDQLASASRCQIGSSLKFALIAAGEGDLYARGVSLHQWDIAAGDAVLGAAGGAVLSLDGQPLRYGGASLLASPFIAIGDLALRARVLGLAGAAGASG